jgi:DNA-directed RNA polymerase subunit RPC12/RpoP
MIATKVEVLLTCISLIKMQCPDCGWRRLLKYRRSRQAELHVLLEDENREVKPARWVSPGAVVIESLPALCREAKKPTAYVGEIADIAQVILKGRGENRNLDAGEVGRRLRAPGFTTEPRDSKGVKLRLSNAVCVWVQELATQFAIPSGGQCCVSM